MRRLCVGGPLDGDISHVEPTDKFIAVFMQDGVEVSRHEYRHVVNYTETRFDVEVFAHSTVSSKSAVARVFEGLYRGVTSTTWQPDPRP